ncbi:CLAVATA3/ESR (CLE)-related protein TDIF-like [Cajanus cajan]|uniref:CLAVATA3/ESR (CLE)-related protein TDIF-like n=1 Tax=Cajanus cajan TaxID=3821 RepID=UPI00098DB3E9|nr:CLAVATA3/ESR (CLE)-related protein TDIF-like [Cajanus cajan]
MAGDTASSFSTCLVLFLSLLLVSHFTMAILEQNFSPLTSSNKEGTKKRNTKVAASAREHSAQHSKDMALGENGKGSIHVPKRDHSQYPSRIFNASAHEVPSGPNPISNR